MMKKILSGVLAAAVVVSGATITTASADAASVPKAAYTFNMNKASKNVVAIARKGDDANLTSNGKISIPTAANAKKIKLKYVTGKHGKGLNLERQQGGLGYGVELKGIKLGTGSWSVSMWVKAKTTMSNYMSLFFTYKSVQEKDATWVSITKADWLGNAAPTIWSHNATGLGAGSSNKNKDAFPWYSNNDWNENVAIAPGKWVHVVLAVNAKKTIVYDEKGDGETTGYWGKTYINGKLWGNGAVAQGTMTNKNKFYIGINAWDAPFAGVVDDVQLYKSALSAKQVKALYKSQQKTTKK